MAVSPSLPRPDEVQERVSRTVTTAKRLGEATIQIVGAVGTTVLHGAREVFGQVLAVTGARDGSDDVPGAGLAYEQWSKADLYRRAQELELEGRSQMTKDELVAALRSAS